MPAAIRFNSPLPCGERALAPGSFFSKSDPLSVALSAMGRGDEKATVLLLFLSGLLEAPAAAVAFPHFARIRHRRDSDPDLGLLVAFDGCLLGAAVFLAPNQRQYVALLDVGIDHAERQHPARVPGRATEHREADGLFPLFDRVE